jgi:hypothetical protein
MRNENEDIGGYGSVGRSESATGKPAGEAKRELEGFLLDSH